MTTPVLDLDAFKSRVPGRFGLTVPVRYSDLDPNNHVNHARYLAFLEEARVAFRDRIADRFPEIAAFGWPIGEINVRYRRPVGYPGTVVVEVAALAVGRTSLTLGYGVFTGDETTAAAVAMTRSVCVDLATGRPQPIPDPLATHIRSVA